jgi:hypothetical protein
MIGASNWLRAMYRDQLPAPAVPRPQQQQAPRGDHYQQHQHGAFEAFGRDPIAVRCC